MKVFDDDFTISQDTRHDLYDAIPMPYLVCFREIPGPVSCAFPSNPYYFLFQFVEFFSYLLHLPGNTKEVLGRYSNPFSVTMATLIRTSCPSTVEEE